MSPTIVQRVALLGLWSLAALACGRTKEPVAAVTAAVSAPSTASLAVATLTKPAPTCEDCRNRFCRDFVERDVVAGCLERVDVAFGVKPDPKFIEDCTRAVRCAYEHDCAYDRVKGAAGCYCGSRSLDECAKDGPAADAPCVEEWKAATRSTEHSEIIVRFDVGAYPSGWATNLLTCDRDRCGWAGRYGRCTPLSKQIP